MKSIKKHPFIFVILFFCSVAFAAGVGDDTFIIGKPGSTANKEIKFRGSTRSIRDNLSTGKLEFSQDGSTFKEIGSGTGGGGGGDNFLANFNPGFEDGTDSWTSTGSAVFAVSAVDNIGDSNSLQSATYDTGGAAILRSTIVDVPLGSSSLGCIADFRYQFIGGTPANVTATIVDGSDALLATFPPFQATIGTGVATLVSPLFDCSLASQLQIKIEFTADEPLMKLDQFFIGSGKNAIQASPNEYVGGISKPGVDAACFVTPTARNAGFVSFAQDSDCLPWTETGKATAIGVQGVPRFSLPMTPGSYMAVVDLNFSMASSTDNTTNCTYSLQADGDRYGLAKGGLDQTTDIISQADTFTATFEINDSGDKIFEVVLAQNGGTINSCAINFESGVLPDNAVKIYKLNGVSQSAVTLETSGFYVKATSSGANINLGTTPEALRFVNGETTLINHGAQEAKMPCDGSVASGATCPGATRLGLNFVADTSGLYKICYKSTWRSEVGASGNVSNFFKWVRVSNDGAQTELTVGDIQHQWKNQTTSSSGFQELDDVIEICEEFDLPAGENTLLVKIQTASGGTAVQNQLLSTTMYYTVQKINQQFPTPVFTDLQDSLNTKADFAGETGVKQCSWYINSSGAATITFEYGNCLDSVTDLGTSSYRANFTPGFWGGVQYSCLCLGNDNTLGPVGCISGNITSTSIEFLTFNTSSTGNISRGTNVFCTGK